ncbi:MAG TPA: polyprenyl synthetase family protein [Nitrososphaeraceae archaeon]|nr:polyprenyl synthetase family protein [Nitrososphaeraceae archaeon]
MGTQGTDLILSKRNQEADPVLTLVGDYVSKIDNSLMIELGRYSWSKFYEPLIYACGGGKRIRPLILLLAAESIKISNRLNSNLSDDIFLAASAIELLHTESVIHDDIIDQENLRRGKPSFHVKFGYNSSILTADFVLGIILNIGSKIRNPMVSSELSKAAIKMSEGEMMEIQMGKNPDIDMREYIQVLENKTASLFQAASKIGAILGGGSEDEIHSMSTFGQFLGIAYQINDDLVDWNNEDRLFNALIRKKSAPSEIVPQMEDLYLDYSARAKNELLKLQDSLPRSYLERLSDMSAAF